MFLQYHMKIPFLLLSLIFCLPVFSDISRCKSIQDDIKRLECFDSFFVSENSSETKNNELIIVKEDSDRNLDEISIFGLPKKIEKSEEEEIKISSTIKSVSQKLDLKLIIILENNQIWQTVEKIRDIRLKDGYEVEIREGFLSGYALRVPGKKIKLRVRRLK